MSNRFSQIFTLTDIFNNKKLKNKIPLINYREKELEGGKISRRTNTKSVGRQIYDTSVSAARPFYKPLFAHKFEDTIVLEGELVGDHDDAVDAVYNSLQSIKPILVWTVNNADMIRDALKEAEANKRNYGINSKLYLRVQSMQQIEGMTQPQIQALMSDIMDNIIYGNNFPKTQKKWTVEKSTAANQYNRGLEYDMQKRKWQEKVGEI